MPDPNTRLHLDMWRQYKKERTILRRVRKAVRAFASSGDVYGLDWGDPEDLEPLRFIRDGYVLPYVRPEHVAEEIGPGGGRWTKYMLGFRTLYAVGCHPELLKELTRGFNWPNIKPTKEQRL